MNDKYVFIDKNFGNLEVVPNPFESVAQPEPITGPMCNFHSCGNLVTGEFIEILPQQMTMLSF